MRYLSASDQPLGSTRTLLKENADGGPSGATASTVRRTVLPGGLRVITETMPGARSATLGLWTKVGSRDESRSLSGATHFLEHLLFKGTKRRTALDISAELDAVGGELNAFTGKEYTCYHARVLDADVPLAIDVICDMVASSLIPEHEVVAERNVILEEIAMHDDDPDDVVHDAFVATLYGGETPLGRSITGSVDSINALTRRQITGYYARRYTADNLVFAAAGAVDHNRVVRLVRKAFEQAGALGDPARTPAGPRTPGTPIKAYAGRSLIERPMEQSTFVLGMPSFARNDPRRFALGVVNAVLGGGTSSRLFQEIRETRGLAYTIYSFTSQHVDAGYFAVAGGCMPNKLPEVLDICRDVLARVVDDGLTAEELTRGKGQMRGTLVMGLEDSSARMTRIGKSELVPGGLLGTDETLALIDAVTLDDVRDAAAAVLTGAETLAVVGPAKALSKLP